VSCLFIFSTYLSLNWSSHVLDILTYNLFLLMMPELYSIFSTVNQNTTKNNSAFNHCVSHFLSTAVHDYNWKQKGNITFWFECSESSTPSYAELPWYRVHLMFTMQNATHMQNFSIRFHPNNFLRLMNTNYCIWFVVED